MRAFGGRLTRPNEPEYPQAEASTEITNQDQTEYDPASLRADAPAFVPGQETPAASSSTAGRPHPRPKQQPRKPPRNVSKSTANDIATRTHEDILNGFYECPICTSELGRRSKVWSCRQCWTVFHLSCIKKWSTNDGSVFSRPRDQDRADNDNNPDIQARQWRCPGCNLPHDILPTSYSCWCEKELDPRPLPGLPPHSCGQTCSKSRKGCPHPCDSTCHAGPCPPCRAMGPTQHCFCGRHESTKRCVDTDYVNGWSCQEACGEALPCMEHTCKQSCHEGLCGECEELVTARCYCGKITKEIPCRTREDEIQSENQSDSWTGAFNCGELCNRLYDCGQHSCQESCHPQEKQTPHCPSSPDMISHCSCGKTKLSDMPDIKPRTDCNDPIPNCQKPCDKPLLCGHNCPRACHTGSCPPCFLTVDIKCRCGRSSFRSMCHQGKIEPPMCFRLCKATLNCGRHACGERCCPGERKSIERLATKRKLKSLMVANQFDDDDIEAEHICTRVCGRTLKCSTHQCEELCHKGSCSTCREAIFEEVSCNCGRSVLYPPQPCGTKPPVCNFNCERPKRCGHPQTQHNCHPDEESCPKCPFLTEKRCLCWKKVLKNQPCWLVDARCGLICGKELQCGSHSCKKQCHRPGDCEDSNMPCQQACGKIKKLCSHPCSETCHAPFPCPEKSPCQSKVTITCPCGRLKKEKRCGAFKDKGRPQQSSPSPLKCDEECGRLHRNRTLASALSVNIDPSTTTTAATGQSSPLESFPYSDDTLDMYIELSTSSTLSTLQTYESTLHSLAMGVTQRSARFQPARSQLRAFTHSLAEDWGLKSESFDPEPNRHVLVFKSPNWLPPPAAAEPANPNGIGIRGISVGECVKLREMERMKDRAAKREAAAEKARIEAAMKASSGAAGEGGEMGNDGWAQVASRKRPGTGLQNGAAGSNGRTIANGSSFPFAFGDMKNPSSDDTRFSKLVLRSGVGMGRGRSQAEKSAKAVDVDDVVEDWEEEVEKEEREQGQKLAEEESHANADE